MGWFQQAEPACGGHFNTGLLRVFVNQCLTERIGLCVVEGVVLGAGAKVHVAGEDTALNDYNNAEGMLG